MSTKRKQQFEPRKNGDSFKPIVIVHKSKKGIPTVIEIEKKRYFLDAESARKHL